MRKRDKGGPYCHMHKNKQVCLCITPYFLHEKIKTIDKSKNFPGILQEMRALRG